MKAVGEPVLYLRPQYEPLEMGYDKAGETEHYIKRPNLGTSGIVL
jgi:hypothetical protein